MNRNAQQWPQDAPGSMQGVFGMSVYEMDRDRLATHRSAYDPKLWSLMSPHGVFIDERKRTHLCMGVVKGEEPVNWDTERMARGLK